MTNLEATYLYRRDIKAAVTRYRARLRVVHKSWGEPIPVPQDCAAAMIEAYGTLRVEWAKADQLLEARRAAA